MISWPYIAWVKSQYNFEIDLFTPNYTPFVCNEFPIRPV